LIYEFECLKCNTRFEELTTDRNKQTSLCPDCQGTSKRVISKVNFNAVDMKSHRIFGHGT